MAKSIKDFVPVIKHCQTLHDKLPRSLLDAILNKRKEWRRM